MRKQDVLRARTHCQVLVANQQIEAHFWTYLHPNIRVHSSWLAMNICSKFDMTPFTQVNIVDLWWTPFEIRRHRNSSWHVMAVHLSTPSVHIDMLEFMDLHPLISFTVEGFPKYVGSSVITTSSSVSILSHGQFMTTKTASSATACRGGARGRRLDFVPKTIHVRLRVGFHLGTMLCKVWSDKHSLVGGFKLGWWLEQKGG